MKESSTYQDIFEQGQLHAARDTLLFFGELRFIPAGQSVRTAFEAIEDLARLRRIRQRLLIAKDWDDLLATP
jgi:hypothetical protein